MRIAFLSACVSLVAVSAGAQPPSSSNGASRNVLLVGNSVNGTVSVIDDDGKMFRNLGTINVIPDLGRRMTTMNLLFWRRLIYNGVKKRELVSHLEPDAGHRFIDDLFLSTDGTKLYVSRGNLADIVAFDLADAMTSAKEPKMLWRHGVFAHADHATLSENGKLIVVSVSASNRAEVLDATTGKQVSSFRTAELPHQNEYSANGARIYNGNLGNLDAPFAKGVDKGPFILTVVDSEKYRTARRIAFTAGLRPMVLTPDEHTLFIQLSYVNGVMKYSIAPSPGSAPSQDGTESPTLLGQFNEPDANIQSIYKSKDEYPHNSAHHGLALSGDGTTLCDCGTIDHTVSLVKTADMTGRTIRDVGKIPYWATTSTDGGQCFVSLSGDDAIAVVDYQTGEVKKVTLATDAGTSVTERKDKPYFPQRTRRGALPQRIVDRLFLSSVPR
jgi:DNA-binding beta-propeller fold protein YncE